MPLVIGRPSPVSALARPSDALTWWKRSKIDTRWGGTPRPLSETSNCTNVSFGSAGISTVRRGWELDRVADQVDQGLHQAVGVAADPSRGPGDHQLDAYLGGQDPKVGDRHLDDGVDLDVGEEHGQHSCFETFDGDDVVAHSGQPLAATQGGSDHRGADRGELAGLAVVKQLHGTATRGGRRAQLAADRRDELALHLNIAKRSVVSRKTRTIPEAVPGPGVVQP